MANQNLEDAAAQVKAKGSINIPVRTLLGWFGARRRSWRNVLTIRAELKSMQLMTDPDFESEWIDATVAIKSAPPTQVPAPKAQTPTAKNEAQPPRPGVEVGPPQGETRVPSPSGTEVAKTEPVHRISLLDSANRKPVHVTPTATVTEAVTTMMLHDYSQLPVMQSDREVKGLFSWRSLGQRLALGRKCEFVRDCMETPQEIPANASLFDAVRIIQDHDCVLVRAADKTISGIVTASDISLQFHQLAEPFLLLGDIESHIRRLIGRSSLALTDLQAARDGNDGTRTVTSASDLTFGEYVRLLENEQNWAKLAIAIDRKVFISHLSKVRDIRNDVMHFDPDPIDIEALTALKQLANMLARLQEVAP